MELANGATVAQAAKKIGVTDQTYLSLPRTRAETDFRGWNTLTHGHVAIIGSAGDVPARATHLGAMTFREAQHMILPVRGREERQIPLLPFHHRAITHAFRFPTG